MVFRGRADDPYLGKSLFLDVHYIVQSWRVVVLDWFRQFLRGYTPFDVARRLHYYLVRWSINGLRFRRDRFLYGTHLIDDMYSETWKHGPIQFADL